MGARIFPFVGMFSVLGAAAAIHGCKGDKFAGGLMPPRKVLIEPTAVPTKPPPPPQVPTGAVMVGCTTPSAEAPLGNTVATGVAVSVDRLCPDEIVTSEQVQQKRLADIVFVLDVTKSMQSNIDTVKENILEFAAMVGNKGWDVRYAGVAFRDPPGSSPEASMRNNPEYELTYTTPFMDQAAFRNELASGRSEWIANDRSDNQEGGLYALQVAANLLSQRRPEAEAVILYVSDAPGFRGNDHWDFTVQETALRLAALSNFKFFHSTLAESHYKYTDLPRDPRWKGDASFAIAKNQADELLRQSGKPGGWLRFPLDRDTFLGNFAEQFDTVTNKVPLDCFLQSAEVLDGMGNVTLSLRNDGTANFLMGSLPLRFPNGLIRTGRYQYKEHRCCARRPVTLGQSECEKSRDSQAEIVVR